MVFYYSYIDFLNRYFDYAGFEYYEKNIFELIFALTITFIPCIFYKEGKISSFISIFIYTLLYIPIIFCFTFIPKIIDVRNYGMQISFFLGMVSFFKIGNIKTDSSISLKNALFSPKVILIVSLALSVITAVIFRDNLKFVSFEDVYDLRESSNKVSGGSALLGYMNVWMMNFFMPACLSYGIVFKKKLYSLAGIIIAVVLYTATGAKIAILFPLVYLFFDFLYRKDLIKNFYSLLVYSISGIVVVSLILLYVFPENTSVFMLNSVLLSRTIGNGGLLTYWYDVFFENHQNTFYSHINVINAVTGLYPYDRELGLVVGGAFWDEKMNANANFWATDGIAGAGLIGVIIINIILSLILYLLNIVSANYNKLFVILLFLPFISMFLNTSTFTALLSGGAFLSILFILSLKK
jgi:hypothetical protein